MMNAERLIKHAVQENLSITVCINKVCTLCNIVGLSIAQLTTCCTLLHMYTPSIVEYNNWYTI